MHITKRIISPTTQNYATGIDGMLINPVSEFDVESATSDSRFTFASG